MKPDYIGQIDRVASEFVSRSYEDKLLNSWHSFEEAARALPREYDVLDPHIPEKFFAQMTDFIRLLYENQDGTPETDCAQIRDKDAAYGGSWHSRGGTGAFHALARKGDRLVSMLAKHKSLVNCKAYASGEAIDDTIGDLRRYLILIAAWHWAAPPTRMSPPHVFVPLRSTRFSGPPEETCDVCGRDPRNSIHGKPEPISDGEEKRKKLIEEIKAEIAAGRQIPDDEPPPPPVKPCPECKHPLTAHDEDGCNELNSETGVVCGCSRRGHG